MEHLKLVSLAYEEQQKTFSLNWKPKNKMKEKWRGSRDTISKMNEVSQIWVSK